MVARDNQSAGDYPGSRRSATTDSDRRQLRRHEPLWMAVAHELIDRSVSGTYPPGSIIPTEVMLCDEFEVSRTVVREAIRVLADKGILEIHRGLGTAVRDPRYWSVFDSDILQARLRGGDRETVLREVLTLRQGIEPELASRAALAISAEACVELTDMLASMQSVLGDTERYLVADGKFHDFITEQSGVALGRDVLACITEPVRLQRQLTSRIPGNPISAHDHHVAIAEAVLAHDPVRAFDAMRLHLQWTESRLDAILEVVPKTRAKTRTK